ncbi:MAG TPA: N-acetylmuramoyl-L-alanine amidase, partial [Candidatus Eisenbacteria bacterium]|nr:N-acetylmuramoyl-L-alanine amidase [Candidatus Eisenbacteria bacterium]
GRPLVLVDAGHGGHDMGAIAPDGLQEKEITLDLARRLRAELLERGFSVEMTRDTDVFVPLDDRARRAGENGARFFISVHANAAPTPALRGFELYFFSPEADSSGVVSARAKEPPPASEASKFDSPSPAVLAAWWDLRLADAHRRAKEAVDALDRSVERSLLTSVRRQRPADFRVLKWAECPAVLVETGYLTNKGDERLLKSANYRSRLARALADGLAKWREKEDGEKIS